MEDIMNTLTMQIEQKGKLIRVVSEVLSDQVGTYEFRYQFLC